LHSICSRACNSSPPTCAELPLPLPVKEPFIETIVERVRALVSRQTSDSLDAFATTLSISPMEFRTLINDRAREIDALFVIDLLAALVHEFAVDPRWLLTGQYNGATHREALVIGEDRTPAGVIAIRKFVREEFERLRDAAPHLSLPETKPSIEHS